LINKVVREAHERLPADVMRAAADAGLGTYDVTWKPKYALTMIFGLFAAVATVGLAAASVVHDQVASGPWWRAAQESPLAVALVGVMALLALVLLDPRRMRMRVFGFAGGLVLRDRKGDVGAVSWDGIATARRALKGVTQGSLTQSFVIELPDGESWVVSEASYPQECLDAISGRVERELTARRLPEAEGRIAGGGRVECGGMVVDATGITGSTLTVRWPEVRRVVDNFAVVRVLTARGWRELFRAGDHPTPDVYLLVGLTRRLARG
jgi:hypothetical protein